MENPPHQALRILNEKYMKKTEYSKTWKVIDTEYLIKRPWLTARRDHLLLPDGREIPEYYVLEYPNWVNVIAITIDGHFVMERQYRLARCHERKVLFQTRKSA